ncbi:MAG: hypothetical protein ABL949_17090 [Fimbriimonadaceae bacterium]
MSISKFTVSFFGVIALLAGCSNSKEAQAIDKMKNNPKAGHVRVFNASTGKVDVKYRNISYGAAESGLATAFKPAGVGTSKISLIINGTPKEVEAPLKSDIGTTICVLAGGEIAFIEDEPRYPKGGQNARVLFLDEKMKPVEGATAELVGPAGKTTFKSAETMASIAAGDWKGAVGNTNVDPTYFYTIIFTKGKAGWDAHFLVNSPTDKPVSAGSQ